MTTDIGDIEINIRLDVDEIESHSFVAETIE
jgi:hypothetical protein